LGKGEEQRNDAARLKRRNINAKKAKRRKEKRRDAAETAKKNKGEGPRNGAIEREKDKTRKESGGENNDAAKEGKR
jgi:hypothetical protein